MKNFIKGLLLSALFIPTLTGCGSNSKTITIHADFLYWEGVKGEEVYLAQGLANPNPFGKEGCVCTTKKTSVTMQIEKDWTYREVYQNHLFGCLTKYSKEGVDTYFDVMIMPTRFGVVPYFAETLEGLDQYNVDWTKQVTGKDLWIRFAKPAV